MTGDLGEGGHRPWPPPRRPWWGTQVWHSLGFLHWPVPVGWLRSLVPEALEIEQFDGTAWVAVTPFWMSEVTLRGFPPPPLVSRFPELNTRTYVTREGRPGVWFFSLDAGSRLAVAVARARFRLPYHYARMSHRTDGRRVTYRSERKDVAFSGWYEPRGEIFHPRPGTVEHFLTERYCLYARDPKGRVYRAEIHHEPWPLQVAAAGIERNTMLTGQGIPVSAPPALVHFALRMEVKVWSPARLAIGESGAGR